MAQRSLQISPDVCKNLRKLTRNQYKAIVQLINDEGLSDDEAFSRVMTAEGYVLNAKGNAYIKQEVA